MKFFLTVWRASHAPFEWELPSYDACLAKLMSDEIRQMDDVQLYQIEIYRECQKNVRNVVVLNALAQ